MFARDLDGVTDALKGNHDLRERMHDLIRFAALLDPVFNLDPQNTDEFRNILADLADGKIKSMDEAAKLSRERMVERIAEEDKYGSGKKKVCYRKLINKHFSRFYNQAVLSCLIFRKETECYIYHTLKEDLISPCELEMAGKRFGVMELFGNLLNKYEYGKEINGPIIPAHDMCKHVVHPIFF